MDRISSPDLIRPFWLATLSGIIAPIMILHSSSAPPKISNPNSFDCLRRFTTNSVERSSVLLLALGPLRTAKLWFALILASWGFLNSVVCLYGSRNTVMRAMRPTGQFFKRLSTCSRLLEGVQPFTLKMASPGLNCLHLSLSTICMTSIWPWALEAMVKPKPMLLFKMLTLIMWPLKRNVK